MQTVSSAFDAMAAGTTRYPTHRVDISWTKAYDAAIDFFTIGTSLIGDTDIIKGTESALSESDKFGYEDETDHAMIIEYQREFIEPLGSVARAMADVVLDNNTDRFTPGADPDIGDFILPRRPVRLYLGFDLDPPELVQTFVGEIADNPEVDTNENLLRIHCRDFFDTIWNTPLQNSVMYQGMRTDEILEEILIIAGLTSGQYDLDVGVNTVGFAYFEKNQKLGPIIQKLVEAELGRFYLDERGFYRFENRQYWTSLTSPVLTITDDMVKAQAIPSANKLINVATVQAKPREVRSNQLIWQTSPPKQIDPGETIEFFADYEDPVASVDEPTVGGLTSYYSANTEIDGTGDDISSSVDLDSWDDFGKSSKGVFTNNSGQIAYLTVVVWGQPARVTSDIFVRYEDQTSVGLYGEFTAPIIDNDFIQDKAFATTLAQILVYDRKDPGDYKELTIIGNPALQLGDLVEWNSINYNVLSIKTRFSAADGLIQTLTLVSRTLYEYFTIGVSTIGGSAQIAP